MKMKTVVISPFSRKLNNGQRNAKNYPYWAEVVDSLKSAGVRVIQVGENGEERIGADETMFNLPLRQLKEVVKSCDTWSAVDNFFPHFCALHGKMGVAIFGTSDPAIFGHATNINLLKDRAYLRQNQYDIWDSAPYDPQVFVSPDVVIAAIKSLL